MKNIEEEIAKIIYWYNGGMDPLEYEYITGNKKKLWASDKPWDTQPEKELCEWERDEYRSVAKVILQRLKELDLFK